MQLEDQINRMKNKNIYICENDIGEVRKVLKYYSYKNFIQSNKYFYFSKDVYKSTKVSEWKKTNKVQKDISRRMLKNINTFEMNFKAFLLYNTIEIDKVKLKKFLKKEQRYIKAAYSRLGLLKDNDWENVKNDIDLNYKIFLENQADIIQSLTIEGLIAFSKKILAKEETHKVLLNNNIYKDIHKDFNQGKFANNSKRKEEIQVYEILKEIAKIRGRIFHATYWSGVVNNNNNVNIRKCIYYNLNDRKNEKYIDIITTNGAAYSKYKTIKRKEF